MTDTIRVGANIQYNTSVKGKVSYHRSAGREVVWYIVYKLRGYLTRMSPIQYINTRGADNSWTKGISWSKGQLCLLRAQ